MCRNHRGFVRAVAAAAHLGADLLLLNTDFPAPQLSQALDRYELAAIVADAEFAPVIAASGFSGPVVVADSPNAGGSMSLEAMAAGPIRLQPRPERPGRTTILSSGTTGAPKGAGRALGRRAMITPFVTLQERIGLRSGEPMLIGPPLFHGFGLSFLMMSLFLGCPVVISRRFDPAAALASIERERVTCVIGVPLMLQRLLTAAGEPDTSSLHAVVSAGAPLAGHVATAFMDRFGDVVFNAYGSSETGFGSLADPAQLRRAPGTVGTTPLGVAVRILDDQMALAPAGQVGHIFIGSELVFDGYDGGGSKDMVAGLMNTGDLGHFDASGLLFIDGREDDMIVSGGENVFPQEVEDLLASHPDVADATVLGVPDAEFGQRLKAFVVTESGSAPSDTELLGHVKEHLARYKVPREITFVEEIPRTPTGKVLRRLLG
jgi:fatty-acyl-CoA synthase